MNMKWLTNAIPQTMAYNGYLRQHPYATQGEPKPTSRFTAAELTGMGFVGLYIPKKEEAEP